MKGTVLPAFAALLALLPISPAPASPSPCKPNEMRRLHVAAPVAQGASELQVQQECLAWEATVQPRAEFALALAFSPRLRATTSEAVASGLRPKAVSQDQGTLLTPAGPGRFSLKLSGFPAR